MRDMTAAMQLELSAKLMRPLILTQLDFKSQTVRNHNGLGNLQWDGWTWIGVGWFLSIQSSEEASDGRSSSAVLSLSGIDASLIATAYSDEYQGRQARVWIGAVDAAGAIVADPVPFIFGLMDTISDAEDGETATFSLTVKTQMLDQRVARAWRLTDAHQQELFPGDRGLEYAAGLELRKITFGGQG